MIHYRRTCDQCGADITDSMYDTTFRDNAINEAKEFCDMKCLRKWIVSTEPVTVAQEAA
jgi:hypothetical protein